MIDSMTGFGRGQARAAAGTLTAELRSVNHRFLEAVVHLPSALQEHEERARELIRRPLRRGRVTCTVTLQTAPARAARVQLDVPSARAYHRQLTSLARRLGLRESVTLAQVLTLPRVVTVDSGPAAQAWWPVLERALTQALQQLVRMRAREGQSTAKDVQRHLTLVTREADAIAARTPHVVQGHRDRLTKRLAELAGDVAADPQRVAQEVALFAANADVAEELDRLRSHVAQFRRQLHADGEQGRSLDFIAQEMFREANTLGAKANDYEIAHRVIAIKGALEKVREQVQNVV